MLVMNDGTHIKVISGEFEVARFLTSIIDHETRQDIRAMIIRGCLTKGEKFTTLKDVEDAVSDILSWKESTH